MKEAIFRAAVIAPITLYAGLIGHIAVHHLVQTSGMDHQCGGDHTQNDTVFATSRRMALVEDLLKVLQGVGSENFTEEWVAPGAIARDPLLRFDGRAEIKKFQFAWASLVHRPRVHGIRKNFGPSEIVLDMDVSFR